MISLDFETFSECDIKKAGTSRYAEDPSTEILCLAYAIGDEDPILWIAGDVPPHRLFENVKQGVSAFNALFEIQIWRNICVKRMGWPDIPLQNWYDTQADCLALGLPDSLDKASSALNLPHKKDRKGTTLINKLCKPRKPTANNPSTRIRKQDDPEAFRDLYLYCKQDVRVERHLRNSLPYRQTESGLEREIYLSTIRANMRGIPIDVITLKRINALIEEKLSRLQHDIFRLTDGAIASINQNQAIQAFLNENWSELKLQNMQGDTIDRLLKKDIDPRAREILVCYSQGNYASIKKFKKIAMQLCADGTIKDNQQYHGAGTGRDAGRGVQVQNLPRASISDPEFAIEAVRTRSLDDIEFLYGNILELASALCRPILMAKKGRMFANADLSQIEDRKGAWIAKEDKVLDDYRKGIDPYASSASDMFHIPLEQIDKKNPLRQAGKITRLACIAEGQMVTTDHGFIPIEKVTTCMKVWDGVSFVKHQGAIYQGEKEVLQYDGLLATPDHVVYTKEGEKVELQKAARIKTTLLQTRPCRTCVRESSSYRPKCYQGGASKATRGTMPVLWYRENYRHGQPSRWKNGRMSKMQQTSSCSRMATKKMPRRKGPLYAGKTSGLQKLRGKRYRVQIQFRAGYGYLDKAKLRSEKRSCRRSYRQQRSLRTWEYKMGFCKIEQFKQAGDSFCRSFSFVSREVSSCPVCGQHLAKFDEQRVIRQADCAKMETTKLQTKRRVWDILNAGPRSRFTVAGKLVSNCQFGGGAGALIGMAGNYGQSYEEEEAQEFVNKFRASRPKLVNSWYAFGNAARDAVLNPDVLQLVSTNEDFQFLFHDKHLYLRMPNGRKICFPFAKWEMIPDQRIKLKTGKTFFIKAHYGLTHWWCNTEKGKRWEKREIRGPSLFQSAVQGLARDVLMEAILRLEKENYPHLFRVHDEVTCDVPDDASFDLQHFARVFSETPDWCKDLPIDCDPWLNKRFKK